MSPDLLQSEGQWAVITSVLNSCAFRRYCSPAAMNRSWAVMALVIFYPDSVFQGGHVLY